MILNEFLATGKALFSGFDIETEQDPVGLLGMEALLCPPFLVCRE